MVGIRLSSPDGKVTVPDDDLAPVPFDGDGAALLRGAPPGSWQVRLEWQVGTRQEQLDLQDKKLDRLLRHFGLSDQ